MEEEMALTLSGFSQLYHILGILIFTSKQIYHSAISKEDKLDLMERLNLTYTTALEANLQTFFEAFKNMEMKNLELTKMKSIHHEYLKLKSDYI